MHSQIYELEQIECRIYKCLLKAYDWLFKRAINTGNWGDVRSTSIAALSLTLREPRGSKWLETIKNWLIEQQELIDDDMGYWNEELWDTSLALIALSHLCASNKDAEIQKAINWIKKMYNASGRCNWHDEPWETSWCIMAILEFEDIDDELLKIACDATKWLLSLQDENGRIICPHYTGYFLLIYNLLNKFEKDRILKLINLQELNTCADKAAKYLLKEVSEKILWTGEVWSNGQILWALTVSNKFPYKNLDLVRKIVNWFEKNQKSDGSWGRCEDTASAVLGMYYLLRELETKYSDNSKNFVEVSIYNKLRKDLETPKLHVKKFIVEYQNGYFSVSLDLNQKILVIILLILSLMIYYLHRTSIVGTIAAGVLSILATIIHLWEKLIERRFTK